MKRSGYKILLLDAPQSIWKWFDGTLPSPALAIFASYFKTLYELKILDLNIEKKPWTLLKKVLAEFEPDLVALPCTHTCHLNEVEASLRLIRKFSPKSVIIGGGVHFNVFYKEFLEKNLVDFVCLGEGELTFTELAGALSDIRRSYGTPSAVSFEEKIGRIKKIDGLAFSVNDEIIKTGARKQIENLDTIPLQSYELFQMERYKIPIYGGNETFGMTFGRGCRNRCCYCSESFGWNYTLRRNSPAYAVKHIELLHSVFNRRTFIFADTDFLVDKKWCEEFVAIIKEKKLKINFHIQTACRTLLKNVELLPKLKEIGLFEVMLGTESPFQKVLDKLKSFPQSVEIMTNAMKAVKGNGLLLMAMMFWGTEYDDAQTLRQGLKFFDKYADIVCPNAMTPYPGTPLYNELTEKGVIRVDDLSLYDQSHIIVPAGNMSYAQTRWAFEKELILHFNFNPKFYMGLFSKNRFLRTNYWHYLKLIWMQAFEGLMSPVKYRKELYAKSEFDKIMGS
ncbi:MAG TPA: radical SAM protein [Candidatus Wallbacteria bacterium]|nr:radical SAM protein [Candidatus Wallbacteria bacterium]